MADQQLRSRKSPSKRSILITACASTLLIVAVAALVLPGGRTIGAEPMPVKARFIDLPLREPSGAAYHAPRGSLLVNSDEGQLVELNGAFEVINRFSIPGDIEGVSVHPATGTAFLASESAASIIEYDLDARHILRTLRVDWTSHPDFSAGIGRNKGLEGVVVIPAEAGAFALYAVVESKPARLIKLGADVSSAATEAARAAKSSASEPRVESIGILESLDLDLTRMSDVSYDAGSKSLLVISSVERVLRVTDTAGRVTRTVAIPGDKPEGFCFLPNGDAIVAEDTNPGGAWICERLRSALFP